MGACGGGIKLVWSSARNAIRPFRNRRPSNDKLKLMKNIRLDCRCLVALFFLTAATDVLSIPVTPSIISLPSGDTHFADTPVSVDVTVINNSWDYVFYWTDWHIAIWEDDLFADDLVYDTSGVWPVGIQVARNESRTRTVSFTIPAAGLDAAGVGEVGALELYATFTPTGYLDENKDGQPQPGEWLVPEAGSTLLLLSAAVGGLLLWRLRCERIDFSF
jgi:hypothetical protein